MQNLDPDDPRPPFQQVSSIVKAAIVTGDYEPGDKLPSVADLSRHFGVAPMTVQKAVGVLRDEGLIVSRQGKGLFVRQRMQRAVGLRRHVEQVFASGDVRIDFAGFTGETLYGVIQEPLDKIRAGQLGASSVTIRVLIPDLSNPVGLPSLVPDGQDSPGVRNRLEKVVQRSTQAIVDTVSELVALGMIESGSAQVRVVGTTPSFKLFILNGSEAFFGFYPVVRHTVAIEGEPTEIFDSMGKDAALFHFAMTDDESALDSQYIDQAQGWFNSMWDSVARDYDPR